LIESTPSPSGRVATPPVSTTPDAATTSAGVGVPSSADSDTADTGPSPAKRRRLRSTKSELFLVNSEPVRDVTETDSSCDTPAVGGGGGSTVSQTVMALMSDDSIDSLSVADVSQNSVADVSALSADDAARQPGSDAVVNNCLPSADINASDTVVEVGLRCDAARVSHE